MQSNISVTDELLKSYPLVEDCKKTLWHVPLLVFHTSHAKKEWQIPPPSGNKTYNIQGKRNYKKWWLMMILKKMFLKGDTAQQFCLKGIIYPSNNSVSPSMRQDQKAKSVCSAICTDHIFLFSNLDIEYIFDQSSVFKIFQLVSFLIPRTRSSVLFFNLCFKSRRNRIGSFIRNNVK